MPEALPDEAPVSATPARPHSSVDGRRTTPPRCAGDEDTPSPVCLQSLASAARGRTHTPPCSLTACHLSRAGPCGMWAVAEPRRFPSRKQQGHARTAPPRLLRARGL